MPRSSIRVSPGQESVDTVLAEPRRSDMYEEDGSRYGMIRRLNLLVDQRFVLLRIAFAGLLLSTLLAFLIPPRFESRTQLMPPNTGQDLASMLALSRVGGSSLGMLAGDLMGLKTTGSLFIGILRSETVEDRIIEQFNLKSVYGVRRMQDARRRLEADTQISEDRKSGIIAIDVTDQSPVRAAEIAQAYISELNRLVVELNTTAAHRERVFLEERLKTVKQDLDASAKALSEFSSKNTTIDLKEQGRAMVEAAATLQGRLIAAQSELEGLRQIYADTNVRVKAVRARIEELQKRLDQMGGGDLKSSPGDAGTESLYPSIRKLPLLGVTYSDLYRTNKIQETLFEMLTQQCEMAKVQEAKETPSVKILDAARVPEKKSFPPRLVIMILGSFIALMIGCLWLLGKANWQELDSDHPVKLFVTDTAEKIKGDLRLTPERGQRLSHMRDKILWFRHPPK